MICSNMKYLSLICAAAILASCESDDGIDVQDISIPGGYALSAGTATVFTKSTFAYDTGADWLSGTYSKRFDKGDKIYSDVNLTSDTGLGPVYAGYSCGSCHRNSGRTKPSTWEGGSGTTGFSSMLVYITRKNGSFFPDYGRVLHDQSIEGVKPEGKLKVTWSYESGEFPLTAEDREDGVTTPEKYELALPHYQVTEWYTDGTKNYGEPTAEAVKPEDLNISVRIPLRHVGMGQLMSLDPTEIEALAAKSNYPEYGISGRCNYITERGVLGLGISGNKAQHQDLTVELGFSSDMGATNSRYPEEICEGQSQMQGGSMMGLS